MYDNVRFDKSCKKVEIRPRLGDVRFIRHHLVDGTLVYLRQQGKEIRTRHRVEPLVVWAATRSIVEDVSGRTLRGGEVRIENVVVSVEIREQNFENVWARAKEY